MFYRNHNLRRAIGLLGVALALLSGIQQGHAFCYLTGCDSASTRVEQSDQMADSLVAACSCSRTCNKTRTKSSASTACEGVANQSEPCPCPPACWCHQLPEPFGLPTSASVHVDLLSQSIGQSHTLMTTVAGCDRRSLYDLETTIGASFESVMLRCAKLCRFLI